MFPQEVNAAQKNLARYFIGYDLSCQNIKLKPFFDEETFNRMIESKFKEVMELVHRVRQPCFWIAGILFIWKIVIMILNSGLNIMILHQTFEWSAKLLANIFDSITQFLTHNIHEGRYKIVNLEVPEHPDKK